MAKTPATLLPPRFHELDYVVADLGAAIAWWSSVLGVGPLFVSAAFSVPDFLFRGRPSALKITPALSHWGDQQIELTDIAATRHARLAQTAAGWLGCEAVRPLASLG